MLRGHLHSTGLSVQRRRVRECIHRIAGSHNSQHPAIFRRSYSVPGPNHLWHVDGNHKMIRWQLVIHGGIDGFSADILMHGGFYVMVLTVFCSLYSHCYQCVM